MKASETLYTIAAVEREVGLSKDVLRVWERRYGFPAPVRDAHGDRLYPAEQLLRLRLVKRLMDAGWRPGRLLGSSFEDLQSLADGAVAAPRLPVPQPLADPAPELLACVRRRDAQALARVLQQRLGQLGLERFVQDTVAPLAVRVGQEWAHGRIEVFEEHLFTEVAMRVLRQAVAGLPPGTGPIVLLTTAPDEPHGLGLLMVESVLALAGARCINLGTQLPLQDIVRAAGAYEARVVGLSFSSAYNARRIPEVLARLRADLEPSMELWAGGEAMRRIAPVAGVKHLLSLQEAAAALPADTGSPAS